MGGKHILLVEDEFLVGLNIQTTLSNAGFDVTGPAMDINSAIHLIEANGFDAAVLDVNLGGQNSGEVASKLSALEIPFLLLTGYGRRNLPPDLMKAPLVEKPFDERLLVESVEKLLRK